MKATITESRVIEILECYGSDETCWPDDEREQAMILIAASERLKIISMKAQQLDVLLKHETLRRSHQGGSNQSLDNITENILNRLPEQQRSINSGQAHALQKNTNIRSSYIATVASIAMICVMVLSIFSNLGHDETVSVMPKLAIQGNDYHELDQWMWQEVEGLADEHDGESTFTAFIDMELSVGQGSFVN